MSNSRITDSIPKFNTYINDTDDTLQAISSGAIHNWERLGLTLANANDWHDKRVYLRDTLYPKYSSPAQSTALVKKEVHDFMDSFRTFGNPLLDIMAASPNANGGDEIIFNFKIGKAPAHHPTTPIDITVVYEGTPLGGGDYKFSCRTPGDGGHGSMAPDADTIQLAYMFIGNSKPIPPVDGSEDVPNPETPGMILCSFTKAIFTLHGGVANVGKSAVVYLRWYNSKHPDLAGPWSAVKKIVLA